MKLLTLNTHSLIEDDYRRKLLEFTDAISELKPDIIALQEVNQTSCEYTLPKSCLDGAVYVGSACEIKADNHAASVNRILRQNGINYNWVWLPIKNGYNKYDEGLAIFSLAPIADIKSVLLSEYDDYSDWHTRKAIGIKTVSEDWFYCVHFGLSNDSNDPFAAQWSRLYKSIGNRDKTVILGDFNFPPSSDGYTIVENSGFFDTYTLADKKDSGVTVSGNIAGWETDFTDKRIDYIFSCGKVKIKSSEVIFNNKNRRAVSDHYGVIVGY